jgi:hypothetical protein
MKTKKLYLFATAFLFLSVFFVKIDSLKSIARADCYDQCADAPDGQACYDSCVSNLQPGEVWDCSEYGTNYIPDGNGGCIENISTGGTCSSGLEDQSGTCYPDISSYCASVDDPNQCSSITNDEKIAAEMEMEIQNSGNLTKCDSYCASINYAGTCSARCSEVYDLNGGGVGTGGGYEQCTPPQKQDPNDSTHCLDPCEAGMTEDPKDPTNCVPVCDKRGYQWSSSSNECRGGIGAPCLTPDECGGGYTCNSSNSCELSALGKVTGGEFGKSPSGTSSTTDKIITATKSNITLGGVTIPLGTMINTVTGIATLPNGSTISLPQTDIAGMLGSVNNGGSGGNGGSTPSPYNVINPSGNGGSNGGGPGGIVAGANGSNSPKCGANFQDIGGVCFPTNTGLSEAPIAAIIGNIFAWLMGLFTTLAVLAFVVSGIQYLMASGNEHMAETAKDNATYALIGIIVGLSGFIIIKAIASALSGQSILF